MRKTQYQYESGWTMKLMAACAVAMVMVLAACSDPKITPQLKVQDLDGQYVTLQSLQGKPVVVNVWATWCAPCRREMPLLQEAQQQNPDVTFVLINQGEKVDAIERYLAQEQLSLKNVWQDENLLTQEALGYQALPSTYFLNAKGELVAQSVGELEKTHLQKYLTDIR